MHSHPVSDNLNRKPQGQIALAGGRAEAHGTDTCFKVYGTTKNLVVRCESGQECTEWLESIRNALALLIAAETAASEGV